MQQPIKFERIEDTFEDIRIFIQKAEILQYDTVIPYVFSSDTVFTSIYNSMSVADRPSATTLVGDVSIIFKSQAPGSEAGIILSVSGSAKGREDRQPAAVFCKLIQYLFDWIINKAKQLNLFGPTGQPFVFPAFLYSASHFERAFPDTVFEQA